MKWKKQILEEERARKMRSRESSDHSSSRDYDSEQELRSEKCSTPRTPSTKQEFDYSESYRGREFDRMEYVVSSSTSAKVGSPVRYREPISVPPMRPIHVGPVEKLKGEAFS